MTNIASLTHAFRDWTPTLDHGLKKHDIEMVQKSVTLSDDDQALANAVRVRSLMFKVVGINDTRHLQFQNCPTRYPVTPQNACNMGFVLTNNGYGVVYDGDCWCLEGYHKAPESFLCLMIEPNGEYRPVHADICLRNDGSFIRMGENGVLIKLSLPEDWCLPQITVGKNIENNSKLFAFSTNEMQWVLTSGLASTAGSSNSTIATTLDCWHGACGAPLFDIEGRLLGFGATIDFEGSDSHDVPLRIYGQSWFERLSHMVDMISDVKPSDCVVRLV